MCASAHLGLLAKGEDQQKRPLPGGHCPFCGKRIRWAKQLKKPHPYRGHALDAIQEHALVAYCYGGCGYSEIWLAEDLNAYWERTGL